jgi:dTDP-4-amino-4,6-dideoxygalactose transaminase
LEIRNNYIAFGTPDFTETEIDAVTRVMRSGWVGMGAETLAFEHELAAYVGVSDVVSVNSCTSALFLALLVEGVRAGDEVIVPSLTWCATANAALYLGATPVFCDVDPDNLSATPKTVAEKITARTKAIVVVHFGGYAMNVAQLRLALPEHVRIVEDAAHAFGASYPTRNKVGNSGNLVCFSFYANKNISTADGGAIAVADPEKAEHLRRLRSDGMASNAWSRYINPSTAFVRGLTELGYKMNFTDLQAAIGRVQLQRFEAMGNHRYRLAKHYRDRLKPLGNKVRFQQDAFADTHARHLLVGLFDPAITGISRNDLLLALRARNIGASIHYQPLHTMPLYTQYVRGFLPTTDKLAGQIMTLPISARMTLDDVDYITHHITELLRSI